MSLDTCLPTPSPTLQRGSQTSLVQLAQLVVVVPPPPQPVGPLQISVYSYTAPLVALLPLLETALALRSRRPVPLNPQSTAAVSLIVAAAPPAKHARPPPHAPAALTIPDSRDSLGRADTRPCNRSPLFPQSRAPLPAANSSPNSSPPPSRLAYGAGAADARSPRAGQGPIRAVYHGRTHRSRAAHARVARQRRGTRAPPRQRGLWRRGRRRRDGRLAEEAEEQEGARQEVRVPAR